MASPRDIDQLLADEAAASESNRDLDAVYVHNRARVKDPSQVYSLRLPVDRIEEMRQVALKNHTAPSALMRRWVLERLDEELEAASRVAETREELGADADAMIVMTQEQFREVATLMVTTIHESITKVMMPDAEDQNS